MPSNEVRRARGMPSVHCLELISSIAGGGIHQAKHCSQVLIPVKLMMCVKQPVL